LAYAESLQLRAIDRIDLVVIHCTELPDLPAAREFGEKILYPESGTGNSGHFYVERCGHVEQWVPLQRIAHHVRGYNEHSIGIECVNLGRYPDWFDSRKQQMSQAYPQAQISSLLGLLQELERKLSSLRWITGHETLDSSRVSATDDPARSVRRKLDPGPLFPWREVLNSSGLEYLRTSSLSQYRPD
jgi:N-acetylmuramoyl-L-alanine amidase